MNFRRTATPPTANPPVTIEFSGLMILRPGADNTCNVGIHRWNYMHTFQVILVVYKPNLPPSVVRLLTGPLTDPFTISVVGDPNNFQAYAATDGDLERSVENARDYPKDYRWALNLKERHHNAEWNEGIKPMVILNTGTLYSLNLTTRALNPRYVKDDPPNPPTTEYLKYFAANLAASIVPPEDKTVRLEWTEQGVLRGLDLPRWEDDPEEMPRYVVSLINEPPMSFPPAHDELALYYKVLTIGGTEIPAKARWHLKYGEGISTDRIPCMPTTMEPS